MSRLFYNNREVFFVGLEDPTVQGFMERERVAFTDPVKFVKWAQGWYEINMPGAYTVITLPSVYDAEHLLVEYPPLRELVCILELETKTRIAFAC